MFSKEFWRLVVRAAQRPTGPRSVVLRVSGATKSGAGTHTLYVTDALVVDLGDSRSIRIEVVNING